MASSISGSTLRRGILLFHAISESLAVMSCVFGLAPPGEQSILAFHSQNANPREIALVRDMVGPFMLGQVAVLGLLTLLFGEAESRAPWAVITMYHGGVAAMQLGPLLSPQTHVHVLSDKPELVMAFHSFMFVTCGSVLFGLLAARKPSGKKQHSM